MAWDDYTESQQAEIQAFADKVKERGDAPDWPVLDPAARYGLVGSLLDLVEKQTEADPVAISATFLAAFGSAVGPGPYIEADGARHCARLFVVVTGYTAKSRKGTSSRRVLNVMEIADPEWHIRRGLSSGEGLIKAVSDGEIDKFGNVVSAVDDKRLFVIEEEFSSVMAVKGREGNTLSERIREAFDTGNLSTLTRNSLVATGAHISILGHITIEELRRCLTELDRANGFANRFLYPLSRRSQILPSGGKVERNSLLAFGTKVSLALAKAQRIGEVHRSPEAEEYWDTLYRMLALQDGDGLADAILARPEAHILRLSLTYALMGGSSVIQLPHLLAAEAVWNYCDQSVRYIFRGVMADKVADRLLVAIRKAGEVGLDGTRQNELFGGHESSERLERARKGLEAGGFIRTANESTGGRPRILSVALNPGLSPLSPLPQQEKREIKSALTLKQETTTYHDIETIDASPFLSLAEKGGKSGISPDSETDAEAAGHSHARTDVGASKLRWDETP
jgi:hypothetical protein